MARSPANSPWLPALGCSETASYPVMATSHCSNWSISSRYPCACSMGAKGWMFAIFRPADRCHLGGRVELHRAGAKRNHRPVKCDVLVLQLSQVAQHLGLAAVAMEHGVR